MYNVWRTYCYNHVQLVSFSITSSLLYHTFTVDPEDLRKLSTTLSALATEKQKLAKVRFLSCYGNLIILNMCRLLIRQKVKKVKALQLARVPEGWTWINMMII